MARPKRPLDERVREALSLDELNFSDPNCWHGPRLLMVNGKNTTLLRAAFALMYDRDELAPSWVVRRPNPAPCHDPECRNPRHWKLDLRAWRGSGPQYDVEPLPVLPEVEQDDVSDAAFHEIMTVDDRRGLTASDYATRFKTYNEATYAAAMEMLRRVGEL